MEDSEMLADVKAYDAAKARLESGEDELIPLETTERRLRLTWARSNGPGASNRGRKLG
jgi:hypothetical protein